VRAFMKRHGVTRQTLYRWRKKYGGLTEDDAQRLMRLGRENTRLKALLAARDLEMSSATGPWRRRRSSASWSAGRR
jgi:putative transposase